MTSSFDQAVIIGGSFAGLWTARILADHFKQVTILERDILPEEPKSRPGVPQDQHVHVLLQRGADIMGQLFPNIEEELLAAGAKRIDLTMDSVAYMRGQWLPQFQSGHFTYASSRILLESVLRRRVKAIPNVTIQNGARVERLLAENGRISGVALHSKDGVGETAVYADLIVDASGRRSKTPDWLVELGYEKPKETVIDAQVGYAGRRYKKPADSDVNWDIMFIGADKGYQDRGGLIYTEENDVWMVMLAGVLADYPPTDEAGYLAYAKDVHPDFYAVIQSGEPISNIIGYRKMENRMRHFEKLTRWPDRFVVLGDAVCGFNPVYGQGMSVSAMAAEALGNQLAKTNGNLDGMAWQYQKKYNKLVGPAWLMATSADLEWLVDDQEASLIERIASWYFPQMFEALPIDHAVYEAFIEVQNLTATPAILFSPKIMWRVFKHWFNHRGRATTPLT